MAPPGLSTGLISSKKNTQASAKLLVFHLAFPSEFGNPPLQLTNYGLRFRSAVFRHPRIYIKILVALRVFQNNRRSFRLAGHTASHFVEMYFRNRQEQTHKTLVSCGCERFDCCHAI